MSFRFLPAIELLKAAGHKYIKRVPVGTTKTGRTRYRYVYRATQTHRGKHFLDPEHMVENASFMYRTASGEEVHAHIKRIVGDRVIYVLDDGPNEGKEVETTKAKLAADLAKEHKYEEQMQEQKKEAEQELEQQIKTGTNAQIAEARKDVAYYGGKPDDDKSDKDDDKSDKDDDKSDKSDKSDESPKKEIKKAQDVPTKGLRFRYLDITKSIQPTEGAK